MREIAKATGRRMADVDPGIFRPPVKPVKLGVLATCEYSKEEK
jgi:hypothetical protein